MDAVTQTTDDLTYDGLNRLTQAVTSNPSLPLNVTKTVTYDAIGNITAKSDVGTYSYDPMRVHAVASIAPGSTGTVTASYTYDANGNMLTGRGRTVTWTSFDMVSEITQGANSVAFTYDSEHARLKQVSSDGSTKYYLNDPISGVMAEKIVGASLQVTWNDYVMLGGEMIALRMSGATSQIRYFHKDHLGSIVALTDESGAVVERSSFDAWGQRRTPLGEDDPLYPGQSITSQITRGFTGHEQLDSVGLVHMNGRIYEPVIGKMMSPDPTVPNPIDGQAYNRYTYVQNNPLSLTDPSGFAPDGPDDRIAGGKMREQSARATERRNRPAHHSIHQNSFAGLTNGDLNRLFPVGDVGGGINPQANQITEGEGAWDVPGMTNPAEETFWDRTLNGWYEVYVAGPIRIAQSPFALAGMGMGYAEELCGACFDPGLAASLMGIGPVGGVVGGLEGMVARAWQGIGSTARVIGGVDDSIVIGDRVFRVYGEQSRPLGASWTKVDPRTVDDYRGAAGLPDVNSGRFTIEGTVTDTTGITTRAAQALDRNPGGLPEVVIPDAASKVRIDRVSGNNPPF